MGKVMEGKLERTYQRTELCRYVTGGEETVQEIDGGG